METAMTKLSRDARDLLCAARAGHAPPREARERVRARVLARVGAGVAVGSATALGTSSTAAKTALSVGLFAKCAAVVGALGVVALVAVEARPLDHDAPPGAAPAASVAAAPSPELPDPPVKPMESASAGPADASPVVTATPSAARSPSLPAASRDQQERPPPGSSLEAETALLEKALGELRAGHPEQALAAFDDAAQKGGVLHEEQRAGRIFALCAAGRTSEAKAEAARFLAESPRSPLAARVRSSCAGRKAP
jgi:hypothetical protein